MVVVSPFGVVAVINMMLADKDKHAIYDFFWQPIKTIIIDGSRIKSEHIARM